MFPSLRDASGTLVQLLGVSSNLGRFKLPDKNMTLEASTRPRYKLNDLMAEMPQGLPRLEGWDARRR